MSVSIPAWYDWESCYLESDLSSFFVSIPAWYDWEHVLPAKKLSLFHVSIPAWYDWEHIDELGAMFVDYLFQFQLGTIGRNIAALNSVTSTKFQFQLGTIGRFGGQISFHNRSRFNSSLVRLGVAFRII